MLRELLERERWQSVRGEDLTMKREIIIAALILACILAPYQASQARIENPTTSLLTSASVTFQQMGYVGVHLSGTLREFSVATAGQPWNRVRLGVGKRNAATNFVLLYEME